MTHNLTPTAQHSTTAVALPDDGEDDGIESIETAFQALLDRSALALAAGSGLMRGADEFAVEHGGTSSSFTVTVGGIQSLILPNEAGTLYQSFFYVSGSPTITEANIAGGVLANSTRYYVYAFNNAGTLAFEIVTDPPRASRVHKTGAGAGPAARRYLGTFATNSSGAPLACRAVRGRYVYEEPDDIVSGVHTANISTFAAADLSSRIPPHARIATVRARVTRTPDVSNIVMGYALRTPGATNPSFAPTLVKVPSLADFDVRHADVVVSPTQTLEYATTANDCIIDLAVASFQE